MNAPLTMTEILDEVDQRVAAGKTPFGYVDDQTLIQLCRLARLGLRVEGAPVAEPFPAMGLVDQHLLTGKRVALVVLEDSE